MYTFYYLNRNLQLGVLKVDNPNQPVYIPEDLIFCNLRIDSRFEKEPSYCLELTDLERLIFSSEFTDTKMINDSDFRKAFSYLNVTCQVDFDKPYFGNPVSLNFDLTAIREEGEENLYFSGFGGSFPFDKFKLIFTLDGVEYSTEKLSYYLTERTEFEGNQLLKSFDGGQNYYFRYNRIPALQDANGETKPFQYCTFYNLDTQLISNAFSLSKFIKCANITGIDANSYLQFSVLPELLEPPRQLSAVLKRNGNIISDNAFQSNENYVYIGGYPQSGDAVFIYDPYEQFDNSNYYVIP